jgi:hypothetical protein
MTTMYKGGRKKCSVCGSHSWRFGMCFPLEIPKVFLIVRIMLYVITSDTIPCILIGSFTY